MTISEPGSKNSSRPSHQSLITGTPQAAASKSLPDGHQPISLIASLVTFRVNDEEQ